MKALLFGSLSYLISYAMLKHLNFRDCLTLDLNIKLIKYLVWLIKEIALSSQRIVRIILKKEIKISPKISVAKVQGAKTFSNAVYANSITLTPGTVTVELADDKIKVYAINKGCDESIKNNTMYKKILGMEK